MDAQDDKIRPQGTRDHAATRKSVHKQQFGNENACRDRDGQAITMHMYRKALKNRSGKAVSA